MCMAMSVFMLVSLLSIEGIMPPLPYMLMRHFVGERMRERKFGRERHQMGNVYKVVFLGLSVYIYKERELKMSGVSRSTE